MKDISKYSIVLLSILSFSLAQGQISTDLTDELQNVLDVAAGSGSHGVSAYLIMADGSTWSGQAGENGNNDAITETTLFHGASTTKTNVTALTLLLQEEGILDLDSSWTAYVDLDANFDQAITLRHLLGHTSGIADYLESGDTYNYIFDDESHQYSAFELLDEVISDVPDFSPGANFQYSNSNYVLMGYIIEELTGNGLGEELRSRIWEPLGMDNTYFGGFEEYLDDHAGIWWNFGLGTQSYNDMDWTSMMSFGYSAANIATTPRDLAVFLEALLNGELISESSLQEMLTFSDDSWASWSEGYGLGLHHAIDTDADQVLGHDGYYTNMTSMFHSNECDFTLVTMTNTLSAWYGLFSPMYDEIKDHLANAVSEEEGKELKIFPNPATEWVTINGKSGAEFELINAMGMVYAKGTYGQDLDVTSIPSGLYFVRLANESGIGQQLIISHQKERSATCWACCHRSDL